MRGRAVEVEVVLLDVLAVVALGVREPEHALLEHRVAPVPEGEREAQLLLVVADAGDPVLTPAIGARPRLFVGEVRPRVPAGAVVLPNRSPLPLTEIGTPPSPGDSLLISVPKASLLRVVSHAFTLGTPVRLPPDEADGS